MDSANNPTFADKRTMNIAVAENGTLELRADNSLCSSSTAGCKSSFGMHFHEEPNVSGAVERPACNQLLTSRVIRSDVCDTNAESNSNDFRAMSREEASASISSLGRQHIAVPEIDSISESGWTTYLNTPADSWAVSLSMISRHRDILAELGREPSRANADAEDACEDSSTASDASSGPEQPIFEHDGVQEKCNMGMATRSKRSEEAVAIGAGNRRLKRERLANRRAAGGEAEASMTSALEDTASSSLQIPAEDDPREISDADCYGKAENAVVSSEVRSGDANSGNGEMQAIQAFSQLGEHEKTVNHAVGCDFQWASDAVQERLKVLETLVPRIKELAGKLSEEEMLKITVDYIRTLEFKVKMLDKLAIGKSEEARTYTRDIHKKGAADDNTVSFGPLQDKGLWLVPISAVPNLQASDCAIECVKWTPLQQNHS